MIIKITKIVVASLLLAVVALHVSCVTSNNDSADPVPTVEAPILPTPGYLDRKAQYLQYCSDNSGPGSGSIYGQVPALRGYLRLVGEWNYQEVTVKGSTIQVELNGAIILDADLAKVKEYMGGRPHPGKDRKSGHFGFAGHSDPVAFRNIEIKRLK